MPNDISEVLFHIFKYQNKFHQHHEELNIDIRLTKKEIGKRTYFSLFCVLSRTNSYIEKVILNIKIKINR